MFKKFICWIGIHNWDVNTSCDEIYVHVEKNCKWCHKSYRYTAFLEYW